MRQRGTYDQPFNYEVTIQGMLDARMLVPTLADLLTFTDTNYLPNGFLVSVYDPIESNRGVYRLIDNTNVANINSWVKLSSNDSNVVHKTGTETITGSKTFTNLTSFSAETPYLTTGLDRVGPSWRANTDSASIYFESTGDLDESSNQIFQIGDNGTLAGYEGWKFRNFDSGTDTTLDTLVVNPTKFQYNTYDIFHKGNLLFGTGLSYDDSTDTLTASGTVNTFSNGLTLTGSNVKLGGDLIDSTTLINTNGNSLLIGNSTPSAPSAALLLTPTSTIIGWSPDGIISNQLSFDSITGIFILDTSNSRGITNGGDYEANFVARSLITKQYALGLDANNVKLTGNQTIGIGDGTSIKNFQDIIEGGVNPTVWWTIRPEGNAFFRNITLTSDGIGTTDLSSKFTFANAVPIAILYDPLVQSDNRLHVSIGDDYSISNEQIAYLSDITAFGGGYLPLTGGALTGNLTIDTTPIVPNKYIYFMGDSYTAGYGLVNITDRFSTLVSNLLGYIENNNGVGGTTLEKQTPINPIASPNFVDRTSSIPTYGSTSGYLVIAGGLNDVIYNGTNYTTTNFNSDYTIIINAAITKGWPVNSIVLVSPWYVPPASYLSIMGNPPADQTRHLAFVAAVASLASSFGTKYFDAYNFTLNNGADVLMLPDLTHPTVDGHRIISYGLSRILGYTVKYNNQVLSANGVVELNDLTFRNTSSNLAINELGLDGGGKVVIDRIGHIRNIADGSTQSANISIGGYANVGTNLTVTKNLQVNGISTFNNYINTVSNTAVYPTSKTGLFLLGGNGRSFIDAYSPTSANTPIQLDIQSQSLGDVNIYGNVNFKSTGKLITLSSPLVVNTYLQFPNATGGYPATKTGGLMTANTTAFFIDGFNASSVAIPIYLNNQAPGANVESYGNFFVRNAKSFNVATGTSTFGGPVFITPFSTAGIISNSAAGQLSSITTIPVANGGTGQTTLTANSLLVGNGTTAITQLGNTLTNAILVNTTSGGAPAYSATPFIGGLLTLQSGLTVSAGNISMSGGGQLIGPGVTGTTTNSTVGIQARPFTLAGTSVQLANSAVSNSSGSFVGVSITPAYTQTSTTGATDLLINRTETSVGSGIQRLLDLQVGSVTKFNVDRLGHVTLEGTTSTGATGTGALVFGTSPSFTTPALGTPSALVLTNATGLPTAGLVDNAVTYAKMQAVTTNKLLGSGSGIVVAEITLGTGLSFTGTTLNVATINRSHTIFTPTTGGTVVLVVNQFNIVNPAGTLATLTVTLPSSPANNDIVNIKYTQSVTAVTYNGGTVVDGITSPIAGGYVILTYDAGTTSWY